MGGSISCGRSITSSSERPGPISIGSSGLELAAVPKLHKRLGISQRLDVLHRFTVHHVAYRQLDDLAALGARNVGNLEHLGGNVARRGIAANLPLDLVDERLVEIDSVAQAHEEDHANIAQLARRPVLTDDEALDHLVELLDLAVDLRGADAHAARVERGVGTP